MDDASDHSVAATDPVRGTGTRRLVTLRAGEYWRAVRPMKCAPFSDAHRRNELIPFDESPPEATKGIDDDADLALSDEQLEEEETACSDEVSGKPLVPAGMVLLLCSIKRVDDEIHTVELAGHPREHSEGTRFSMLVDHFTEAFEHIPNEEARAVRSQEISQIHAAVGKLEEKMRTAQATPSGLQQMIEEGLALLPPLSEERTLALPLPKLTVSAEMTVGDALSLSAGALEAQRSVVVAKSREAQAVAKWLQKEQAEVMRTIAQLTPFYGEQAAAALAMAEDAMTIAAKVHKGLANLDLYTGKGVTVETLATGAPASHVPLTVTQARLFADEELSVWRDVDAETFDFEDMGKFADAIKEPSFLDQVFGTLRGVVLMSVRRSAIRYEGFDPYSANARNERNLESWLLIRNGNNVHRVFSSVGTHAHAEMLFPTLDDMQNVFRGLDGSKITLESIAYPDKREKFDSIALHYRRFLLLLCGLDHRLSLFGDFYPENLRGSIAFLSHEFQENHFHFIADGDRSRQLPDGRPSLREWIDAHNERLQSGSRVLVLWKECVESENAPALFSRRENYRRGSGPEQLYKPERGAEVVVAYRDEGVLCAPCQAVGDYDWRNDRRGETRRFTARVVLKAERGSSAFCGWLCLDAVKRDDLLFYIHSRVARVKHGHFIALFKGAAKWLEREATDEASTRALLAQELIAGKIAQLPFEADAIVDEAVVAWRCARRGEPLPTITPGEPMPEGWTSLYKQMWTLAERSNNVALRLEAEQLAIASGRQPLRLISTGTSGAIALYATPAAHEREERLIPDRSAFRMRLRRLASGGVSVEAERRCYLPKSAAKEIVLASWPEEEEWTFEIAPRLRFETQRDAFALVERFEAHFFGTWALRDKPTWSEEFERVRRAYNAGTTNSVPSNLPNVVSPMGLRLSRRKDSNPAHPTFICLGASAIAWLHAIAPDDACRQKATEWIVSQYRDRTHGREAHGIEDYSSFGWCSFHPKSLPVESFPLDCAQARAHRLFLRHSWKEDAEVTAIAEMPRVKKMAHSLELQTRRLADDYDKPTMWLLPDFRGVPEQYLADLLTRVGLLARLQTEPTVTPVDERPAQPIVPPPRPPARTIKP